MFKLIISLFATSLFVSCASVSTMQTAEPNRVGQVTGYGAWVPTTGPMYDINTGEMGPDTSKFQTIEFGGRVGLTENVDMGLKVFPIGGIYDVKYRFLQSGMFHISADLGAGYSSIGGSDSTEPAVSFIDVSPAVLATVRPFSWVAATLTPKMLLRVTSYPDNSTTDILAGATAGLKFTAGSGSGYIEFGKFGGSYSMTYFAIGVERSVQLWGSSDKPNESEKKPMETETSTDEPVKEDSSNSSSGNLSTSDPSASF